MLHPRGGGGAPPAAGVQSMRLAAQLSLHLALALVTNRATLLTEGLPDPVGVEACEGASVWGGRGLRAARGFIGPRRWALWEGR